jgi:hypothetical protein
MEDVISLFLCFSKVSRQIFTLDTFGRQADKYITHGGMFFYVFMFLFKFAYEPGLFESLPDAVMTLRFDGACGLGVGAF